MQKSVIISTIHLDFLLSNYGSFWQHWCLREYLTSKGFSVARHIGVGVEFNYRKWLKSRVLDYLRIHVYWPMTQFVGRKYWSKNLIDEYVRMSCFIMEYKKLIAPLKEIDSYKAKPNCFVSLTKGIVPKRMKNVIKATLE